MITGWERKLMVDANQKWGRAQAIQWMKQVDNNLTNHVMAMMITIVTIVTIVIIMTIVPEPRPSSG